MQSSQSEKEYQKVSLVCIKMEKARTNPIYSKMGKREINNFQFNEEEEKEEDTSYLIIVSKTKMKPQGNIMYAIRN